MIFRILKWIVEVTFLVIEEVESSLWICELWIEGYYYRQDQAEALETSYHYQDVN